MRRFEEALLRLERVTGELDQTAPADLDRIEKLLAERDAAAESLREGMDGGGPPPAEAEKRLEAVHKGGARLREKLLLSKAGLRHRMSGLYQTGLLLKALSAGQAGEKEPSRLDCRV